MSFKVTKVTVGKGITRTTEKDGEWKKKQIEIEAEIQDEKNLQYATDMLSSFADMFLRGESINDPIELVQTNEIKPLEKTVPTKPTIGYLEWKKATGPKGEYEFCEESANLKFIALKRDLEAHFGKITSEGYFYFLMVKRNPPAIGRKRIS